MLLFGRRCATLCVGTSPRSFYGHHAAAVSASVAFAESTVLRGKACSLADELTILHPPGAALARTPARATP